VPPISRSHARPRTCTGATRMQKLSRSARPQSRTHARAIQTGPGPGPLFMPAATATSVQQENTNNHASSSAAPVCDFTPHQPGVPCIILSDDCKVYNLTRRKYIYLNIYLNPSLLDWMVPQHSAKQCSTD
jgi:hypothetical protein